VLIMYFWSALIAFGVVAYSIHSKSMWIVLAVVVLSAIGLVLLLLPRFTPRAPRWAEGMVPPRYRRRSRSAAATVGAHEHHGKAAPEHEEERVPVGVGVSGVNGATAVGPRARFPERGRADSTR
jgi:UDP-GlcNAc:undecaprenyl-phosphate GlcNAc-1-phosphate transferase